MMRGAVPYLLKFVGVLWAVVTVLDYGSRSNIAVHGYEPTWPSLESRPLPEWYDSDKFGIFIHWGVYSVPALGEWFWYNWKVYQSPVALKYMTDNFKPNFTYQDFGRDFTASLFNATEWALMFKQSGARYVVLTSKHHDGYSLWPSKYAYSWNSMDVGPHKDIIADLATAVRKFSDLRFGLYHSLYEWFNPLYMGDSKNNFTTNRFVTFKTMPELYELVESYLPDVIWSDGEWEATDDYWKAKEFLAWLYNESPVKSSVVVNDRWGSNTLCKHGGFFTCQDRYNPKKLQNRKWENAMTIDKRSWGYRKNAPLADYLTSQEIIESLVVTVSCGGNVLLNVGPTSDGKIPPIYEERLLDIGKWLSVNGESIYATKPWSVCQNDTVTPDLWYTEKTGPATAVSAGVVYATFFKWPNVGKIRIKCVTLQSSGQIEFLGLPTNNTELLWTRLNDGVEVILPNKALVTTDYAWTLKIINGTGSSAWDETRSL